VDMLFVSAAPAELGCILERVGTCAGDQWLPTASVTNRLERAGAWMGRVLDNPLELRVICYSDFRREKPYCSPGCWDKKGAASEARLVWDSAPRIFISPVTPSKLRPD
jgi:hypothetical protein